MPAKWVSKVARCDPLSVAWAAIQTSLIGIGGTGTLTLNGGMVKIPVGGNSVPANLTNNRSAVFAIDTAGSFSAITDQSTVGNGTMFLGTSAAPRPTPPPTA